MRTRTKCPDTPDGLSVDMARQAGGHTPPFRGVSAVRLSGPPGGGRESTGLTDVQVEGVLARVLEQLGRNLAEALKDDGQ